MITDIKHIREQKIILQEGMEDMKRYQCVKSCFFNSRFYEEGKSYFFPPEVKVPHHFEPIVSPKEEMKKVMAKKTSSPKKTSPKKKSVQKPKATPAPKE